MTRGYAEDVRNVRNLRKRLPRAKSQWGSTSAQRPHNVRNTSTAAIQRPQPPHDVRRKNGSVEPNAGIADVADISLQILSVPDTTKAPPKPKIRPPQAPPPPREPKTSKALRHHDGGDGLCHVLLFENRTVCGIRLDPNRARRWHIDPTGGTGAGTCGGCGRPKCPKCLRKVYRRL
jgi:hypothetical protein